MSDYIEQIMEKAEEDNDVALGALQEALSLMSELNQKKVLEWIKNEEE